VNDLVLLPFHQDERLSDRSISLPTDVEPTVVEPDLPEADQWQRLVALYEVHAGRISESVRRGPIRVVTGDCLAAVGTLVGLQRRGLDPSVVWFDAHGDVHTLESSTSGYLGGLPLRMALGGDYAMLGEPLGLRVVPEDRVVLVDARDLDPPEEAFLAESDVTVGSVEKVSAADLPDGPVLLHVDLDVVDAAEIPRLRFPAAGGPTGSDVVAAVKRLISSGRVVAFEVACPWFEPTNDEEARRHADVLAAFLAVELS
jgi:arginase